MMGYIYLYRLERRQTDPEPFLMGYGRTHLVKTFVRGELGLAAATGCCQRT